MVHVFPDVDHETFWDIVSNVEDRIKWDDRWVDAKIVEKPDDESWIIYMLGKRPPLPVLVFSQRDVIY